MKWFACSLLCLVLSACLTSGKRGNEVSMSVYDLGVVSAAAGDKPDLLPLSIEVRAPAWLDSMGIDYRLAYNEPANEAANKTARLREYSQARWAAPPAHLLQQYLAQELKLMLPGQGRSLCILRLDLNEFSQVFDSPSASRAVLKGRLQLLDRARNRLAEREVYLEQAAASADSKGAVSALIKVSGQLLGELKRWEAEQLAGKNAQACVAK
jgi:cholesterol transport system auxiliary component